MGGWFKYMDRKVEEIVAVRMSYPELGGWVGGWKMCLRRKSLVRMSWSCLGEKTVGGWVVEKREENVAV